MDNQDTYGDLQLTSPAFKDGEAIPIQYTCKGQGVNPPLNIVNTPEGTKSLALVMHDPDAISSDYVHWLVWGISPSTKAIAANSVPIGAVQGSNSASDNSYAAPCPPSGSGTHRYMFELYALDSVLNIESGTDRQKLEEVIKGHILDYHKLTGLAAAQT